MNAEGAIGVVVMSNSCEGSSDYLSVLSDADSVNYNYTVPVISVTCTTGKSIINSIAGYPSTIATISSVGERTSIVSL